MTALPTKRNGWFALVLLLTAVWLFIGGTAFVHGWRFVDCDEVFEMVPEPVGWQKWPREQGVVRDETLFGFRFTHHQPRGFWYGGYEDSQLTSARSCPGSSLKLDGWLRAGETFWLRHPEELSRYRDPASDVQVIAGQYGYDPNHASSSPPQLVVAFRLKAAPRRSWEYFGTGVELVFALLAGAGIWVVVLRARGSPHYASVVAPIAVLGLLVLGLGVALAVNSALQNMR